MIAASDNIQGQTKASLASFGAALGHIQQRFLGRATRTVYQRHVIEAEIPAAVDFVLDGTPSEHDLATSDEDWFSSVTRGGEKSR